MKAISRVVEVMTVEYFHEGQMKQKDVIGAKRLVDAIRKDEELQNSTQLNVLGISTVRYSMEADEFIMYAKREVIEYGNEN